MRDAHVAAEIREHSRWNDISIELSIPFEDAFHHANWRLAGRMAGICNLDILRDAGSDWSAAEDLLRKAKAVLCWSRQEFTPPSTTHLDPTFDKVAHALTQDARFLIPPLEPRAIDFELGTRASKP